MSKENRKRTYDRLIAEGRLSQDDGALEKEFGAPSKEKDQPEEVDAPKAKPKKK